MPADPERGLTPAEYLALERPAEFRHELRGGERVPVPHERMTHGVIRQNLSCELNTRFKGTRLRALSHEMRVRSAGEFYTYPDVLILDGEPHLEDEHRDTLLNPAVILEVLSPATESYDRTLKFDLYREIPSFVEYVLVSQERMEFDHYVRRDDGSWEYVRHGPVDPLRLVRVPVEVPLSDIYYRTPLAVLPI